MKLDGLELQVRDSGETKVDDHNRLIIQDLKRQKVDGLKSTLHTCFQSLDCLLKSIGPLTFMLKTVIYRRVHGRDSNRSYSLLETIQFKSRPSTLEWTVCFQIDRRLLSVYFTSRPSTITYRLQSKSQQNVHFLFLIDCFDRPVFNKILEIPDFQEITCLGNRLNSSKFFIFRKSYVLENDKISRNSRF